MEPSTKPKKRLIKSALQKTGLWAIPLAGYRCAQRLQGVCYSTAGDLRLGFAIQLRFLRPQFIKRAVYVRLSSITRSTIGAHPPAYRPVLDGDWDIDKELLRLDFGNYGYHFRLMHEMFVENKHFLETNQIKEMERELLAKGETVNHKFRTMDEIYEYMKRYKPIFNDMKENGYKTQAELGFHPFDHEVRVAIGRDGEILFLGQGNHRLAMAKILDLESVAVSVWTVHKIWAERCFKKYGGGVLEAIHKGLDDLESYRTKNRGGDRMKSGRVTSLTTDK